MEIETEFEGPCDSMRKMPTSSIRRRVEAQLQYGWFLGIVKKLSKKPADPRHPGDEEARYQNNAGRGYPRPASPESGKGSVASGIGNPPLRSVCRCVCLTNIMYDSLRTEANPKADFSSSGLLDAGTSGFDVLKQENRQGAENEDRRPRHQRGPEVDQIRARGAGGQLVGDEDAAHAKSDQNQASQH